MAYDASRDPQIDRHEPPCPECGSDFEDDHALGCPLDPDRPAEYGYYTRTY